MVIIALGESIVAIGAGAAGVSLTRGIVSAAVLGIVVVAALWWAYFDVYAVTAQQRLSATRYATRARLAAAPAGVTTQRLQIKKAVARSGCSVPLPARPPSRFISYV